MSTESALSGLSWHQGETVYSDKWGESGLIFKSSDVTGSLVEQLDMSSVNIVTYIYIYISIWPTSDQSPWRKFKLDIVMLNIIS